MDKALRQKLADLYQEFQAYDAPQSDRLNKWRNLEPESALFLSILVKSKQAKQILEIGTSNGFSTLWLAEAVQKTGGFLTSLEIEASRTAIAQKHLAQFGLTERVDCITIDAADFLVRAEPVYDLILLDAERDAYVAYWPDLCRLLSAHAGSMLVVDNVVSHQEQVEEFIGLIENDEGFVSTAIEVGAGLLLVTKN